MSAPTLADLIPRGHRDILETGDDIGAIFDVGHGDQELEDLRLRHPLFVIAHTRNGWFGKPAWSTERGDDLHAATAAELSAQMTQMVAEYRCSLQTSRPNGWT